MTIYKEIEVSVSIYPNDACPKKALDGFDLNIQACDEDDYDGRMSVDYDLFDLINNFIDKLNTPNNFGVEYSELFEKKLLHAIKKIQ
jgi:hypothetical protein